MRRFCLIGVIGIAIAISATVDAGTATPQTINECARLLPKGKTYTFKIEGSVDTSKTKDWLKSESTVENDGPDSDVKAFEEETRAFHMCLHALVGK